MRKEVSYILILLHILWSVNGFAATQAAESCSEAHVNAALGAASAGDTVTIPAGSCTWTHKLCTGTNTGVCGNGTNTIVRGVIIQKSAAESPVITFDSTDPYMIHYAPNATAIAAGDVFKMTGLTLDFNNIDDTTTDSIIYLYNTTNTALNVVIGGNTFKNLDTGNAIWSRGSFYGVIYQNTFDMVAIMLRALGNDGNSWANMPHAWGDVNQLFFEGNTATFSSEFTGGYQAWIEGGQGGRYVARYNTIDYTNVNKQTEGWDAHGNQDADACDVWATMAVEVYNNAVINGYQGRWFAHRGGKALFYNNTYASTQPSGTWIHVYEEYADSVCTESYTLKVNNSYYWNNLSNGSLENAVITTNVGWVNGLTEGVDFFNSEYSYAIYDCPHPLSGVTGGCDLDIAGTSGYGVATTHTVTPSTSTGCTISPAVAQTISDGNTTVFTMTKAYGYSITTTGCTLSGSTCTTAAVTGNLAVVCIPAKHMMEGVGTGSGSMTGIGTGSGTVTIGD